MIDGMLAVPHTPRGGAGSRTGWFHDPSPQVRIGATIFDREHKLHMVRSTLSRTPNVIVGNQKLPSVSRHTVRLKISSDWPLRRSHVHNFVVDCTVCCTSRPDAGMLPGATETRGAELPSELDIQGRGISECAPGNLE